MTLILYCCPQRARLSFSGARVLTSGVRPYVVQPLKQTSQTHIEFESQCNRSVLKGACVTAKACPLIPSKPWAFACCVQIPQDGTRLQHLKRPHAPSFRAGARPHFPKMAVTYPQRSSWDIPAWHFKAFPSPLFDFCPGNVVPESNSLGGILIIGG